MLGAYPIATRPLAVLAAGGAIIEADASVTITATASFISGATSGVDASSTAALSVSWDSATIAQTETSTTSSASVSWDSTAIVAAASTTTTELVSSFVSGATAGVDASTSAALAVSWDGVARQTIESDFSSTAALSSTWELDARQYSTADMQTTLALSTLFDGARVLPSVFSSVINAPLGPISTFSIANGGSGYSLGQQIRLDGGNNDCVMTVLTRGPGNSITLLGVANPGTGYAVGTYTTTRLSGASGTGCVVNVVSITFNPILWRSGATKNSTWASSPAVTPTWRSLGFATAPFSSTPNLDSAFESLSFAGSAAQIDGQLQAAWDSAIAIAIASDWSSNPQLSAAWIGEVGQKLVVARLLGLSSTPIPLVGELTISPLSDLKGHQTTIHLRGD